MLAKYPATNARDPASYHDALAAALCDQPRDIAIACGGDRGVVTECMFKPTVADIKRWCEREAAPYVERMREHNAQVDAANAAARAPAIIDRSNRPSIDELRAKHGPTWGIKTTAHLDLDGKRIAERQREMRDRHVLVEYARIGIDPVYASDGTLASPSLLRSIDCLPHKRVENVLEGEDMR